MKRKESILLKRICGKSDVTAVATNNACRQPPSLLEASGEDNSHSQEKENYAICVGRLKIAVAKGTKWRKAAATPAAGGSLLRCLIIAERSGRERLANLETFVAVMTE